MYFLQHVHLVCWQKPSICTCFERGAWRRAENASRIRRKDMPLVRIDVRKGRDAAYRQKIGRIVYDALVSVGVPEKDRFQIIAEHEADGFQFDPEYLGIQRSADLVMIQITWNEGRTTAQKQALYKAIADGLHATVGLRREDVLINLIEVKKENWSFGNGIATYAA
jgi:phenylpyruvate tautomerase PptA (4-oxalocrotonate tautomerase family)